MQKLVIWDDETAKKELSKRLSQAKDARKTFEKEWEEAERIIFGTRGNTSISSVSVSFTSIAELGVSDIDSSSSDITVNYAFKNLRFLHSQLSANPPSVVPRPTSSDIENRRKADAADRVVRHFLRKHKMQEKQDKAALNTLLYGTSFIKTCFNPHKGDILEFNEETGELLMEGDIDVSIPYTWDIYLDPDANTWDDVTYVIERVHMSYEEACYLYPNKKDELEKARISRDKEIKGEASGVMKNYKYNVVVIYNYWEKGLPYNGMLGRYVPFLEDGTPLTPVKLNPFRFRRPRQDFDKLKEDVQLPEKAELPFHIWTDIDQPNSPWGKSIVNYVSPLQDTLNRADNVTLDMLQAHGIPRMVLPEGTEIADDSITNSPWDVIKITGTQPPYFMQPMPMPAAVSDYRDRIKVGLDDIFGVNEAMFGQQSREQSGFSMQYATNQGNMIRRRLFNKYVSLVESVYKAMINLAVRHWTEARTIQILGKEKAFETVDIKGSDVDGGFDFDVEYGASLSLDPTSRREEILTLLPVFKEAGIATRQILGMLKLNELEGMYDLLQLAADRQREIFEEMIATKMYIPPAEWQDHENMLAYCNTYKMTAEFKYLAPEAQALIIQHINDRKALASREAAGAPIPGGPMPGNLPNSQGMQGAQTGVENLGQPSGGNTLPQALGNKP